MISKLRAIPAISSVKSATETSVSHSQEKNFVGTRAGGPIIPSEDRLWKQGGCNSHKAHDNGNIFQGQETFTHRHKVFWPITYSHIHEL